MTANQETEELYIFVSYINSLQLVELGDLPRP